MVPDAMVPVHALATFDALLNAARTRPFDAEELEHLQGRRLSARTTRSGREYGRRSEGFVPMSNSEPTLEAKVKSASSPEEQLQLLRQYWVWIEHGAPIGVPRPWLDGAMNDDDCTIIAGPEEDVEVVMETILLESWDPKVMRPYRLCPVKLEDGTLSPPPGSATVKVEADSLEDLTAGAGTSATPTEEKPASIPPKETHDNHAEATPHPEPPRLGIATLDTEQAQTSEGARHVGVRPRRRGLGRRDRGTEHGVEEQAPAVRRTQCSPGVRPRGGRANTMCGRGRGRANMRRLAREQRNALDPQQHPEPPHTQWLPQPAREVENVLPSPPPNPPPMGGNRLDPPVRQNAAITGGNLPESGKGPSDTPPLQGRGRKRKELEQCGEEVAKHARRDRDQSNYEKAWRPCSIL